MSFPWGVAVVLGAGVLVVKSLAAKPASSTSGGAVPDGDAKGRYAVHRQLRELPPEANEVKAGTHIVVQLIDSVRGIDIPATLRVARQVFVDGGKYWALDAVWEGSPLEKDVLEGLAVGTHFSVYPLDIVTVLGSPLSGAKIGSKGPGTVFKSPIGTGAGGVALYSHVLGDEDIRLGPTGFSVIAGFTSVEAFLADNPTLRAERSGPSDIGAYPTYEKDLIAYFKVIPWKVGVSVKTRVPLPTSAISSSTSTDDGSGGVFGPSYAPTYGGRLGYGEMDFGIRNL